MNPFEKVSVLIPTINEITLPDVVSAAQAQAEGAEIIIIGYGEAGKVADKFNVRFLDLGQKTKKSSGLNRAVDFTDRDWIIVIDADAIPGEGWGRAMLAEFEKGTQLFSGSVDISQGNYWMRVYNLSLLHEFTRGKPASFRKHLPAINLGFTRDAYKAIGPFLEDIDRSEDYEWTLRAYQKKIIPYFSSEGFVIHLPVNKASFSMVWKYWVASGMDNLRIRKLYSTTLKTPAFMNWPIFILLASPLLAIIPTMRIMLTSPVEFFRNIYLIPAIYLTKIAWCIGVYKDSKKSWKNLG